MIDIVRYLLDWPKDSKGKVIFTNPHEAIFYAIIVENVKALAEEIEVLRNRAYWDLEIEKRKPDGNIDRMIHLASRYQFYSECIDTSKKLFREEGI